MLKEQTKTDIEQFILSVPNILELSLRAHILLVGYYLRRVGSTDFSPYLIESAFKKINLPCPQLRNKLNEFSQGEKSALVVIKKGRYSLSLFGLNEVENYLKIKSQMGKGVESLRNLLDKLSEGSQKKFLEEAINCANAEAKRASIVMTWLLAVDHLQEYIIKNRISDFNVELGKRTDTKIKRITIKDDFTDLKESIFIEVMRAARIITNDVRKILEEKLGTRNTCSHPSDIIIHESKVVNFIEDLVDNVILKYK